MNATYCVIKDCIKDQKVWSLQKEEKNNKITRFVEKIH